MILHIQERTITEIFPVFANQPESYCSVKLGNITSDVVFDGDILQNG